MVRGALQALPLLDDLLAAAPPRVGSFAPRAPVSPKPDRCGRKRVDLIAMCNHAPWVIPDTMQHGRTCPEEACLPGGFLQVSHDIAELGACIHAWAFQYLMLIHEILSGKLSRYRPWALLEFLFCTSDCRHWRTHQFLHRIDAEAGRHEGN